MGVLFLFEHRLYGVSIPFRGDGLAKPPLISNPALPSG
jgi:hypothetical protein